MLVLLRPAADVVLRANQLSIGCWYGFSCAEASQEHDVTQWCEEDDASKMEMEDCRVFHARSDANDAVGVPV